MSDENLEVVKRSFELFLRGDLEAWIEMLHPDVGWDISAHPLPDVPNHGRGRDAFTGMMATYLSGWTDYSAELKELGDAGDEASRCSTKRRACATPAWLLTATSCSSGRSATDG